MTVCFWTNRSLPYSHTAKSSAWLTALLQASDHVRHMLSLMGLNPSPLPSDLRAVHCHPLELPFLQNFRQLTVAHSACMCHNLFAVFCFSHFHFTTNKKSRRPFLTPRLLVFSGPFCYSPFFLFFRMIITFFRSRKFSRSLLLLL